MSTEEARKRCREWWNRPDAAIDKLWVEGEAVKVLDVWLAAERAAFDRCAEIARDTLRIESQVSSRQTANDLAERILKERP